MVAKIAVQDFARIVEQLKDARPTAGAAEKRRGTRIAVHATVAVTALEPNGSLGRTFRALARDVSITGIGLLQSVEAHVGQELIVALPRGPGADELLHLRTAVVFCAELADGLFGVGGEFHGPASPELLARLAPRGQAA